MQSAKEKLSNMASAAKEHADIYKAKLDEKTEKARARTEEEKVVAHEEAKAREAKAKMELHDAKARHAADKARAKVAHLPDDHRNHLDPPHNQPLGAIPKPGTITPAYALARNHHPNKHL